jgi:hypothetical protein
MKEKLINEIYKDEWMMNILKAVRELNLPDCWVGAGFVRNKAWDILHEYKKRTPLTDIDVVYLDRKNVSEQSEAQFEQKLRKKFPNLKWEVINQARTHLWHNRSAYSSTEEAISEWVETATCIGIRLTENDKLELIAPYGLEDIECLILRPIPCLNDLSVFHNRMKKKSWLKIWPKLTIKL